MVIKKHQTLFDFCLQHCGSLEYAFALAVANGLSVSADVDPGTELTVVQGDVTVVASLKRIGAEVTSDNESDVMPGGIGYMQIGNDFKIR